MFLNRKSISPNSFQRSVALCQELSHLPQWSCSVVVTTSLPQPHNNFIEEDDSLFNEEQHFVGMFGDIS